MDERERERALNLITQSEAINIVAGSVLPFLSSSFKEISSLLLAPIRPLSGFRCAAASHR